MKWILPKDELPPMGYKVLCYDEGDYFVAQRFREYWFAIPFTDSKFADHKEPQKWSHIEFTEGNKGYMYILYKGELRTLNEIDKIAPDILDELINKILQEKERK